MNLVRSNQIAKGSEMGWARVSVVMKRMGKNKSMSRYIKPLMKMYRNLEDECQRDYAVAKVLERVEAAEASGRGVDLEAAQATQVRPLQPASSRSPAPAPAPARAATTQRGTTQRSPPPRL